jgi:Cu(I)/Ag(I) efflux system membrane fusion protein
MRKQLIVSLGIIAVAATSVVVYAVARDGNGESGEAAGHNHGTTAPSTEVAGPVQLDPERARRIGVTFATAEAGPMISVVRTVGSITYDETRLVNVSPKIEGWVEKLYVDFTGAPVAKGQPLMAVYSPMLVSAQEELILATRLVSGAAQGGAAAANGRELLEATRRRLSYWDIPASEIERIERTGTPQKTLILRSPAGGLVVEKAVIQGQRIMPGMDLYRIADLSNVWIEGEVYEKDLALIGLGRMARITFESYPGQTFTGKVTYVYPTITAESRTGRIRIELPNPQMRFKPGMYANLEFEVPVHRQGIHVPRSAVLQTGSRTIVFVRQADGMLMPREVTIGTATTEHIEVLAGLQQGEVVVASANFLVDAESNLGAAVGAMQGMDMGTPAPPPPTGADAHGGHAPAPQKK